MRFLHELPAHDLTYDDAFLVPTRSAVESRFSVDLTAPDGTVWKLIAYESKVDGLEHLALVKGDITSDEPVLVRMHGVDTIGDVLGGDHLANLHSAVRDIAQAGRGVVVLIRVVDNGIGMSPEELERVWEAFYQSGPALARHREGLGLGLSLVRRICTHQGWRITVENLPSGGSCFRVLLDQA